MLNFFKSTKKIIQIIENDDDQSFVKMFKNKDIPDTRTEYNDFEGWTFLHIAVENNSTKIVDKILERSNDLLVDAEDSDGRTPLQRAVVKNNIAIVEKLLRNGASTEVGGDIAPLLISACTRSVELFKLLLDFNAKLNDTFNLMPLPIAITAVCSSSEFIKVMSEHGFDFNEKYEGENLLSYIISDNTDFESSLDKAEFLLKKGLNPSESNSRALYMAIEAGYIEIVKLYIEAGADFDIKDDEGNTPLDYAILMGKEGIARHLYSKGSTFNETKHDEEAISALSAKTYHYEIHLKGINEEQREYMEEHFEDYNWEAGLYPVEFKFIDEQDVFKIIFDSKKYFDPNQSEDEVDFDDNIFYRLIGKEQFFSNMSYSELGFEKIPVIFIDDNCKHWSVEISKYANLTRC